MRIRASWVVAGAAAVLWTVGGFVVAWLGVSQLSEGLAREDHNAGAVALNIVAEGLARSVPAPAAEGRPAPADQGRLNVLLMGVDQRPDEARGGDPGRTDSMVLVALDRSTPSVAMISIPRDLWVRVPGYGEERINSAYRSGELAQKGSGGELAKRAVADVLGVPVHRYALVDMRGLRQVIDQLGGIDVDVPHTIVDEEFPTDDYGTRRLVIPAGRQHMDGETALAYARTRHADSDFGRMARQQQVLTAIRARATELGVIPRLPTLVGPLLETVRTDLAPAEVLALAALSQRISDDQVKRLVIAPDLVVPSQGEGGAYLLLPTPRLKAAVADLLAAPPPPPAVEVLNGSQVVGAATRAAAILRDEGFEVARVADAPSQTERSIVQVSPGLHDVGEQVARGLRLPPSVVHELAESPGGAARIRVILGPDFQPGR